jgi:hypothetical protein
MPAIIVGLISALPQLISTVQQLIARGRQTGELTAEQADALTTLAHSMFAQYSSPAPPPPGA